MMSKTISTTICTTAPAEPTSTYLSKSPCSSFPFCLYCAYSLSVAIAGEKPPNNTPNRKNPTVPTMALCLALYSITFVFVSQYASALPSPFVLRLSFFVFRPSFFRREPTSLSATLR